MGSVCGEGIAAKECTGQKEGLKVKTEVGDEEDWDKGRAASIVKTQGSGLADSVGATSFPHVCVCWLPQCLQKFRRVTSAPGTLLRGQVEVGTQ